MTKKGKRFHIWKGRDNDQKRKEVPYMEMSRDNDQKRKDVPYMEMSRDTDAYKSSDFLLSNH